MNFNPSDPDSCTQMIPTHGRKAERVWSPDDPLDLEIKNILTGLCVGHRKELCGFISDDEDIWRVTNVHKEPFHNFYMDLNHAQSVINEIEKRNTEIIGIWHTHPNDVPWPTPRDLVGWPNPELRWRYWIVTRNAVIEWRLILDTPLAV